MSNPYYNPTGAPQFDSSLSSAVIRAELALVAAGFALLPALTAGTAIVVNSGGTGLTNTTGTLALAGNFATTGAFNTTLVQGASVSLTLPVVSGTLATLAGTETLSNKTLVAPALGTPASGVLTNCTGLPPSTGLSGLGTGVATALGANVTGSGGIVLATSPTIASPTLTTPALGVATATSINGLAITTSTGTLTVANGKTLTANSSLTLAGTDGKTLTTNNSLTLAGTDGKTLTVSNSLTLAGTDSTTMTFPSTSATVAGLGITQTFSGTNTFSSAVNITSGTGTDITAPSTSNGTSIGIVAGAASATNSAGGIASLVGGQGTGTNTSGGEAGIFGGEGNGSGAAGGLAVVGGGAGGLGTGGNVFLIPGLGSTANGYIGLINADNSTVALKTSTTLHSADIIMNGSATVWAGTAIPAGGTAGDGLKFSSTSNFGIFFGSGAPTLSAAQGSLYLRSDGSGGTNRAYINNSSGSGTTWTALSTQA